MPVDDNIAIGDNKDNFGEEPDNNWRYWNKGISTHNKGDESFVGFIEADDFAVVTKWLIKRSTNLSTFYSRIIKM